MKNSSLLFRMTIFASIFFIMLANSSESVFAVTEVKTNTKSTLRAPKNNTWKDRTLVINGQILEYQFWKGNPEEIAITDPDKIEEWLIQNSPLERAYSFTGYVTPEVEDIVQEIANDRGWNSLVNKCWLNLNVQTKGRLGDYSDYIPATSSVLDLENIIQIDPKTGFKILSHEFLWLLYDFSWFYGIRYNDGTKEFNCMSIFWKKLYQNIQDFNCLYRHTCSFSGIIEGKSSRKRRQFFLDSFGNAKFWIEILKQEFLSEWVEDSDN